VSRNLALEKVGRARVAYVLQQSGWKVGEAFDDGYDLLAHHPPTGTVCRIELKAMDIGSRVKGVNLTAHVSPTEQAQCTHIIVYGEPHGWYFIGRKQDVLTDNGNIFAAINAKGELRKPPQWEQEFCAVSEHMG
jgi:hypothetical protein